MHASKNFALISPSIYPRRAYFFTVPIHIGYVIFLSISNFVYAETKVAIYTEEFFPYNYATNTPQNSQIMGLATELVKAIMEKADLEFTLQLVPWARAIQEINNRENVLVYSMLRTRQREDKYYWVGKINTVKYALFGLASRKSSLPKKINEARYFSIGVGRSGAMHNYLELHEFKNIVAIQPKTKFVEMLLRNRFDLLSYDQATFGIMLKRRGFQRQDFFKALTVEAVTGELYISLSKKSDPLLFKKINNAYTVIKTSKKFEHIMSPLTATP